MTTPPDPLATAAAGAAAGTAAERYRAAMTWLFAQRREGKRDPTRAQRLLAEFDIAFAAPSVHVVGTTGKGTVAAMIERGLRATGATTGRFLSPHVEDFRERVEVSGTPIEADEVVAFVDRVRTAGLAPAPAFFEIAYAMALDLFARRGVTFAVVEAGVGARADATISLANVAATVITNVSMDHALALGGTVASIARDKAAAVRPGVPVVTGSTGVARAVITARAARLESALHADPPGGALFDVPPEHRAQDDVARYRNQRLAAAALRLLGAPPAAVAAGVSTPPLPARRERFVVEGRDVVLDGAHNPAAAAALALSLNGPVVVVFGALDRKDGRRTLRELEQRATHVFVTAATAADGHPAGRRSHPFVADPLEALRRALAACPPGGTVVVAGSLYLAGRIRPVLRCASAAGGLPTGACANRG